MQVRGNERIMRWATGIILKRKVVSDVISGDWCMWNCIGILRIATGSNQHAMYSFRLLLVCRDSPSWPQAS